MKKMNEIYGSKRRNGRPQDATGKKNQRELQNAVGGEKPPVRNEITQALIEIARENRQQTEGNGKRGVESRDGG